VVPIKDSEKVFQPKVFEKFRVSFSVPEINLLLVQNFDETFGLG
jgi:hypothetical protein